MGNTTSVMNGIPTTNSFVGVLATTSNIYTPTNLTGTALAGAPDGRVRPTMIKCFLPIALVTSQFPFGGWDSCDVIRGVGFFGKVGKTSKTISLAENSEN